jgi:hypothetical protein
MRIDSKKPVENTGKKIPDRAKANKKKKGKSDFDKELEKAEKKIRSAITSIRKLVQFCLDENRSSAAARLVSYRVRLTVIANEIKFWMN